MDTFQEFLSHPHAEIAIGAFGAVMSAIGFFMIVRKGLALMFALLIFGMGIIPLTYVFKGSDVDFINTAVDRFGVAGSKVPGLSNDVLKSWCDKLDQAG